MGRARSASAAPERSLQQQRDSRSSEVGTVNEAKREREREQQTLPTWGVSPLMAEAAGAPTLPPPPPPPRRCRVSGWALPH